MSDETQPIAVGDKVRWTQTSVRGRTMSMRLREGTVAAIMGDTATVKSRSERSKPVQVNVAQLEQERKETAISVMADVMRGQ